MARSSDPFIVWFGEEVPEMIPAIEATEEADLFLVIGTSLEVYPAAGLLGYVPAKAPVYCIDPKPVRSATAPTSSISRLGAVAGMRDLYARLTEGC